MGHGWQRDKDRTPGLLGGAADPSADNDAAADGHAWSNAAANRSGAVLPADNWFLRHPVDEFGGLRTGIGQARLWHVRQQDMVVFEPRALPLVRFEHNVLQHVFIE